MTVNWKEVAETLAHALQQANVSQGQAPLLAYRLACECERVPAPAAYVDDLSSIIETGRPAFNGLTAEPRVGDRVRVVAALAHHGYENGNTGTVDEVGNGWAQVVWDHCAPKDGIRVLFRREFEILPRDLNPPAVNTGD